MEQRLVAIEHRSAFLENFINQPEASPTEYSKANKELRKLRDSMDLISELRTKQKKIDGLRSLMAKCPDDKDMLEMATEDLHKALEEEKRPQNLLLKSLLPGDDADQRDCILEEASLFAMDVFKMYERYSHKKGWRFEVVDIAESDLKGYKEASAAISGSGVYGKLKFESGIHRVQRVPVTDKSGRIHSSAVSVAILPQADEVDVRLRNEDLRIDTYRSGGSGGQHANTTNSAVHGDGSERIQTYNFPQGRVTDHRVGITYHAIDDVMQRENSDVFVDALLLQQEMDAIATFSSAQ
ncbi:RAD-like 6 [Hibiscus syriacus]|uniref:RAD-like 6 n=1 Tax=Hibiscus syriacus TaxID=106335 RepID=A0A6A3A127_HIBSY|nr:RAD-like 6 [Hibiscus syriacus]